MRGRSRREEDESSIEHIHEAQTTKLLIVAPATADMLAKFAHGLADDFLSTMFLATTAPVIVAPAMNVNDVGASGDAGECGDAAGAWSEGD